LKDTLDLPRKIITGWNVLPSIGDDIKELGQKTLILSSKRLLNSVVITEITNQLDALNISTKCAIVAPGEPAIEQVEDILIEAEAFEADYVIGVGGGSILDVAKAVAGLKFSGRKVVKDYFYGIPVQSKGIPWVAVPTTSGTGSEATPNSVLSDGKIVKQSIRGDSSWLPSLVILDPELTVSCPPSVTAWSGMDALTQAIESYTSKHANLLTDTFSAKAAQLISSSIVTAYEDGGHKQARTDLLTGSFFAGVALGNARLGIVHGVAHSIGLHYNVAHGLVCGTLLPWALKYNKDVCSDKYTKLAIEMGIGSSTEDLIDWTTQTNNKLGIPSSIKEFGVQIKDIPKIVKESMGSGSLKANLKETSESDLYNFLSAQLM
jgi:alcohol dehydrogenase class IV